MSNTSKILVVATEAGDRDAVSRMLATEQFETLTAGNTEDALAHLDEAELVVCDLRLRPSSGVELMRRWHERRQTTPFILVAEAGDNGSAIEAMKHGAADYVTKPVNDDELLVRVVKWLEASHNNERLQQLESRLEHHSDGGNNGSGIDIPAGTSLEDLERAAVEKALQQHHGNRTHAAKTLGISVRTLQRKLKAWRVPVLSLQHPGSTGDYSMHFAR